MRSILTIAVLATSLLPSLAQARSEAGPQPRAQRTSEDNEEAARPPVRSNWRLFLYTGASYSEGDYGTDVQTNILVIPVGARIRNGGLRISASIPYLRVRGARAVIPGEDDPIVEDQTIARDLRSGFGDLRLQARYRLPERALAGFSLDLHGRVKVPTASRDERLGTGEFDYGIGAELSRRIGRVEPFVQAQYRINGEPPDRDYRNSWDLEAGVSTRINRSTASLSYEYSESRVRGRAASQSLNASLAAPVARRVWLAGFGSAGLTQRAPDLRIGAMLTVRAF